MTTTEPFEVEIVRAYEAGQLKSVASRAQRERLKAAARETAIKDRRVNIRLSSGDLHDIQARALAEGMPYQTLIASILHKYVSGGLEERRTALRHPSAGSKPARRRTERDHD